jgi:hypothetical protein
MASTMAGGAEIEESKENLSAYVRYRTDRMMRGSVGFIFPATCRPRKNE